MSFFFSTFGEVSPHEIKNSSIVDVAICVLVEVDDDDDDMNDDVNGDDGDENSAVGCVFVVDLETWSLLLESLRTMTLISFSMTLISFSYRIENPIGSKYEYL